MFIARKFRKTGKPLKCNANNDNKTFNINSSVSYMPITNVVGGKPFKDAGKLYEYVLLSGTLPDGLSLDSNTGLIFGTVTKSGSSTIRIGVKDSSGKFAKHYSNFTIDVAFPKLIADVDDSFTSITVDQNSSITPFKPFKSIQGGNGVYTYSLSNTTIGLTVDNTGRVSSSNMTNDGNFGTDVIVTSGDGQTVRFYTVITVRKVRKKVTKTITSSTNAGLWIAYISIFGIDDNTAGTMKDTDFELIINPGVFITTSAVGQAIQFNPNFGISSTCTFSVINYGYIIGNRGNRSDGGEAFAPIASIEQCNRIYIKNYGIIGGAGGQGGQGATNEKGQGKAPGGYGAGANGVFSLHGSPGTNGANRSGKTRISPDGYNGTPGGSVSNIGIGGSPGIGGQSWRDSKGNNLYGNGGSGGGGAIGQNGGNGGANGSGGGSPQPGKPGADSIPRTVNGNALRARVTNYGNGVLIK